MVPSHSSPITSQINTTRSHQLMELDRALMELLTKQDYSEFELIRALQKPPYSVFPKDALIEPLSMFQTHFVLFNALYRIKRYLQKTDHATLIITALKISWQTATSTETNLPTSDDDFADQKLASYYLDWNNFESTDLQAVDQLLDTFWQRYFQRQKHSGNIKDALLSLQIDPDTPIEQLTKKQVKSAYKALSLKRHPDKGGDSVLFQEITAAYHALMLQL